MSPEEKRSGAVVDEVSNVYVMGANAFVFFAQDDKAAECMYAKTPERNELAIEKLQKIYEMRNV